MSLFNSSNRTLAPAIKLPTYGEVTAPGALATYASLELEKPGTKKGNTGSGSSSSGGDDVVYAGGMGGANKWLETEKAKIDYDRQNAMNEMTKTFSRQFNNNYEKYSQSEIGSGQIKYLQNLQAKENMLKDNIPQNNQNLQRFIDIKKKATDNEVLIHKDLKQIGNTIVPNFGVKTIGVNKDGTPVNVGFFKNISERLTDVWDAEPQVDQQTGRVKTETFDDINVSKYDGTFEKFVQGTFGAAQGSMSDAQAALGNLGVDENGNFVQGGSPSSLISYLTKTESGSNHGALRNASATLYDNLPTDAKFDLADNFYSELADNGGTMQQLEWTLKQQAEKNPLKDGDVSGYQVLQEIRGAIATGDEKKFNDNAGNLRSLMGMYGAIRIKNQEANYRRNTSSTSFGGVSKNKNDGTGVNKETELQLSQQESYINDKGVKVPVQAVNKLPTGKANLIVVPDDGSKGTPFYRLPYSADLTEKMTNANIVRDNKGQSITTLNDAKPLTGKGIITQAGVVMTPDEFPNAVITKVWGTQTAPERQYKNGTMTNNLVMTNDENGVAQVGRAQYTLVTILVSENEKFKMLDESGYAKSLKVNDIIYGGMDDQQKAEMGFREVSGGVFSTRMYETDILVPTSPAYEGQGTHGGYNSTYDTRKASEAAGNINNNIDAGKSDGKYSFTPASPSFNMDAYSRK